MSAESICERFLRAVDNDISTLSLEDAIAYLESLRENIETEITARVQAMREDIAHRENANAD